MPSSSGRRALVVAAVVLTASGLSARAAAQQQPGGFAVERLYPSAPGGGWFVMDDLTMRGGPGVAMALTAGYAHDPLRVSDGSSRVAVVSDQAFADFGFAVGYDRWRLYLNMAMPLVIQGDSGRLTAPSVTLGSNPDTLSDARVGVDVRLLGDATSPLRLGAGAQLIVPNGNRADYDTDGSYRAMGRVLLAGDVGLFTYAGQLGLHLRPLDDSPAPGSPQGSELLYGAAVGARVALAARASAVAVVGPEVFGETAVRSLLSSDGTGLEALMTGRVEGTGDDGPQLRVKLGAGGGLSPHFGAPEWRLVFGLEVFDPGIRHARQGATSP